VAADADPVVRAPAPIGAAGWIVPVALAARLLHLWAVRDTPFFESPFIDSLMYDRLARQLAVDPLGDRVFYQAPLYPYFLALLTRLVGHSFLVPRVVQALLGSLSCLLIHLLGARVFSRRAGLLAGFAAALYGPFIFYDTELLRPSLIIFLSLLTLLWLGGGEGWERPGRWAAGGLLFGLGALAHEGILLFLPAALLLAWRSLRKLIPPSRLVGNTLLLLLVLSATVAPVALRNYLVGGDLVAISFQGGLNFYLGNNPDAARTMLLQPGPDWERVASLPARREGLWRPSEQSAWFFRQGLDFIRREPLAWLSLTWRKFLLFWNAWEDDPNNDLDYHRRHSPLLRLLLTRSGPLVLPFGLVAPLSLLGLLLAWRRRRGAIPAAFLLAALLAVVPFHVRARYRLPAVPVLLILAAHAADRGLEAARSRRGRALAGAGAFLLASGLVVNADLYGIRSTPRLPLHHYLGLSHLEKGRFPEAEAEFRLALGENDWDASTHNSLGNALERQGRSAEAEESYRRAMALAPEYRTPLSNLGLLLLRQRRYGEAREVLARATELDPSYASPHNHLGRLHLELKDYPAALASFEAAARLEPSRADAHFNRGLALLAMGRRDEAARAFGEALERNPGDEDARRILHRLGLTPPGPPPQD
jgi:Flp pilus assembly protein TadD